MKKQKQNNFSLTALFCILSLISLSILLNWCLTTTTFSKLDQDGLDQVDVVITWTNFSSPLWVEISKRFNIPLDLDRLSNNGEIFINLATLILNANIKRIFILTLDGLNYDCLNHSSNKIQVYKQSQFTYDYQTTSMGVESLIRFLPMESRYVLYLNDDMIMNPKYKISFPHYYPTFYWFENKVLNHTHQFVHNTLGVLSQDFNINEPIIPNHRYHIFNSQFLKECLTLLSNRYKSLSENKVRSYKDLRNGGSFYPIYVCQILNIRRDINLIEQRGIENPKYWRDYRSTFLTHNYDFLCLQEMNNEPEAFKQLIKEDFKRSYNYNLEKCGFTRPIINYINEMMSTEM